MNQHAEQFLSREVREQIPFSFTMVVHRHGPKEGAAGALTNEGKERTREYFDDAYENVAHDSAVDGVDVLASSIGRSQQTASLELESLRQRGVDVKSFTVDERLSEGGLAKYEEAVKALGGRKGKWIAGWMALDERPMPDVKTGKEAAQDFAALLLEKVLARKQEGGSQEIEAFSHGTVMAAFLLTLQEKLGERIMPDNWMELSPMRSHLDYLTSFNVHMDQASDDKISIFFHGKSVQLPLETLREMVGVQETEDVQLAAK